MTATERRQRLRAVLAGTVCQSPATVFDALSARVAESVGYEIGVLSGSVSASTLLAAPDLVLQTLTEFADQIRRIMRASNLSLVLDADHGYGNALNVIRTCRNQNLAYDPVRDFTSITQMGAAPFLIVAHPSLPVKTVQDLIALAKAKPGVLNFASGGLGNSGHLTGELFKNMAHIQMTYIPYKGGELALIDLVAGQVHLVFSNLLSSLPHVRSGRVRALAVTSAMRYRAVLV